MGRERGGGRSSLKALDATIRLWALRVLVPLEGHAKLFDGTRFIGTGVAEAVGLKESTEGLWDAAQASAVRVELRALHARAEAGADDCRMPAALAANSRRLADLVGLSPADRQLLEFTVLLHTEPLLEEATDCLGPLSATRAARALAGVLRIPEPLVRASLSPDGLLTRTGLLSVSGHGSYPLRHKLDLLSGSFADRMVAAEEDVVGLLRDIVALAPAGMLKREDFSHLAETLDLLERYLRKSLQTRRCGVNILLHGPPGTGKSELTRMLARELKCRLFEVSCENERGDGIDGERRLRAFRAAQSFFSQRRTMLLFDETEDVFNDAVALIGHRSTALRRKAWINRMLEQNSVPTVWVSNSADCFDAAFIRRFDFVIELPVAPQPQRRRMIRKLCGELVSTDAVDRLARVDSLAPAVVARATSVVRVIQRGLAPSQSSAAVERLIDNTLRAQGRQGLGQSSGVELPAHYDPRFINSDVDLAELADDLRRVRSARLCLYGPPGTGKTAFGQWLARSMEVPLHARHASDILSPWVGGTERNLASAFREAAEEGAVLLLDEVESFLQERRGAQHSWEVTAVNEMLVQIESFPGLLIASTNWMEGLDAAALRRFDLKIRFDYLRPDQAWALFVAHCHALGLEQPAEALQERLRAVSTLTPGDFAAVARQQWFRPLATPLALVEAVAQECRLTKRKASEPVGFYRPTASDA